MVIVNIIGGLGNQMFQFAFAYAVSRTRNIKLKLDISGFSSYVLRKYELDSYAITASIASIDEIQRLKYKQENQLPRHFRTLFKKSAPPPVDDLLFLKVLDVISRCISVVYSPLCRIIRLSCLFTLLLCCQRTKYIAVFFCVQGFNISADFCVSAAGISCRVHTVTIKYQKGADVL